MDFSKYQEQSKSTALYPKIEESYVYPTMGLANEAGEVLGVVKKIFRDQNGEVTDEVKRKIKKELGDVLWYVAQVATEFDLKLDDVAQANIDKLASRKERGTLHGDGDDR